ncbi:MAG: NAD-dependent epimerase/dehydratase family protein [Acidimicrobiales bacterium]
MPTAMLIGGRGFIGSAMVPLLVARGFRVVCVEPTATTLGRLTPWADQVELVNASVADPEALQQVVEAHSPDCMANLVFAHGPTIAQELDVMARGVWNTLDAASSGGCDRVALASSVRVYGPQRIHGAETMVNEESVCRPSIRYGVVKLMAEYLAEDYRRKHGLVATALRIPMVYGPGVKRGAEGVNVPAVAAATGEAHVLPCDPNARLCLAHVGDVAACLVDFIDPDLTPPSHAVYELGGTTLSYNEMVECASLVVGGAIPVSFEPDGRGREHDYAYLLDNTRLRTEYGFEHRSVTEGYREVIDGLRGGHD